MSVLGPHKRRTYQRERWHSRTAAAAAAATSPVRVGRPLACTHKGVPNFNAPSAFISWPFFATIKSAHSTLPYATGLKHTRSIVNHLPCPATRTFFLLHLAPFLDSPPPCVLSRSRRPPLSLRATSLHARTHARTHAPNAPTTALFAPLPFLYIQGVQ